MKEIMMINFIRSYALYFAWAISCAGTLISIFYSYILNVEPCILCYYQRICLFPLTCYFRNFSLSRGLFNQTVYPSSGSPRLRDFYLPSFLARNSRDAIGYLR
uniref:Disulfide bond formation protein B n=1 Tax=Chlamydia pneumoniae TaxID=83558 RepID=A0A0F7XKS9_CHLPN|nr:hypothetical protein BN1224_UZG1_A_02370 [Chlamydia pneumoniae]